MGRADGSALHEVTVLLKHRNEDKLEMLARQVSSPRSPSYGKYWSAAQVRDLIAPHADDVKVVRSFFAGAAQVRLAAVSGGHLRVRAPIAYFERLFSTRFHRFEHRGSRRYVHRALIDHDEMMARLPADVQSRIVGLLRVHDFFEIGQSERKALRALEAREAVATTNAPWIAPVLVGGSDSASVTVQLYCQDGSPASDSASAPCAGDIQMVELTLHNEVQQLKQQLGAKDFAAACRLRGSGASATVTCQFPEQFIEKYRRYNISAYSVFQSGSHSDTGDYATAFSPSDYITPNVFRDFYKIPRTYAVESQRATQGVTAFEDQFISLDDLQQYFAAMGLDYSEQNVTIHGHNVDDPSQAGGESTLDIQAITMVALRSPTTFWSVSGDVKNGAYVLEWALQIADTVDPPLTWSTSYGDGERAFFHNYGNSWAYIDHMELQLKQMAVRGITTLYGSGDGGMSNAGESGNDLGDEQKVCNVQTSFYPASSPWATGVSATFLSYDSQPVCRRGAGTLFSKPIFCSSLGEVAVSVRDGIFWTTGGGTSSYFDRQWYEKRAVDHYFQTTATDLPDDANYNKTAHAYPQISMVGHQMINVLRGSLSPTDGTSMSSPLAAGMFTLLNGVRLSAGLPPLGFLNPLLFELHERAPEVFNDVTVGRNADADIQPRGSIYPMTCSQGFNCAPGFDAATGLGSINFEQFSKHVRSPFEI